MWDIVTCPEMTAWANPRVQYGAVQPGWNAKYRGFVAPTIHNHLPTHQLNHLIWSELYPPVFYFPSHQLIPTPKEQEIRELQLPQLHTATTATTNYNANDFVLEISDGHDSAQHGMPRGRY